MFAMGLASIMLLIGMVLRAKVPIFKKYMVPTSVIAGLIGFVFMNTGMSTLLLRQVEFGTFSIIIVYLFTIAFISIILTDAPKQESESSTGKNILKGSMGMGNTWNILYAFTPLMGALILVVIGGVFGMGPVYGMMLPFGFAQGPGQSVTFGTMLEGFGWENAIMVGLLYSVFGFIMTFLIGIPLAKYGMKRGLGVYKGGEIPEYVTRGHYHPEDQKPSLGQSTTYSGNIDILTFHFAIIGLCLIIAIYFSNWWLLVPGTIGASLSGMLFMNGIFAAVIVKFIIKKLKLDFLKNNVLQTKITAWAADYLVVISFMAIGVGLIRDWIIPILILCVVTTIVSLLVSLYLIPRIGGPNGFERTVAFFGVSVGTVPTALVLLRVIDPELKTTTGIELGLMNLIMIVGSLPIVFVVMAYAAGDFTLTQTLLMFAGIMALYLAIHKLLQVWNKPSFSFFGKSSDNDLPEKPTKNI